MPQTGKCLQKRGNKLWWQSVPGSWILTRSTFAERSWHKNEANHRVGHYRRRDFFQLFPKGGKTKLKGPMRFMFGLLTHCLYLQRILMGRLLMTWWVIHTFLAVSPSESLHIQQKFPKVDKISKFKNKIKFKKTQLTYNQQPTVKALVCQWTLIVLII